MHCAHCGHWFDRPKGSNRITCSQDCADERRAGQLKELDRKRKAERDAKRKGAPPKTGNCRLCGELFTVRSNSQVYCEKVECKEAGLAAAVARQKARREANKLSKETVT